VHNFGEWWVIWTEIFGTYVKAEATVIVPAMKLAKEQEQKFAKQREEIGVLVGRATYHLVVRAAPPGEAPRAPAARAPSPPPPASLPPARPSARRTCATRPPGRRRCAPPSTRSCARSS
jgi:hypothetical protein